MGNYRDNKIYFPGGVYHIYNRGVGKGDVYRDDQDYQSFLFRLLIILGLVPPPKRTTKGGLQIKPIGIGKFEIFSYCLMPNHFHFLIRQIAEISPEVLFRKLLTSYVRYFNLKYDRVGHLFQDNFKYKPVLEDQYLLHLSAYIHNNPQHPLSWAYSSLPHFLHISNNLLISDNVLLGMLHDMGSTYQNFFEYAYSADLLAGVNLTFEEN